MSDYSWHCWAFVGDAINVVVVVISVVIVVQKNNAVERNPIMDIGEFFSINRVAKTIGENKIYKSYWDQQNGLGWEKYRKLCGFGFEFDKK